MTSIQASIKSATNQSQLDKIESRLRAAASDKMSGKTFRRCERLLHQKRVALKG